MKAIFFDIDGTLDDEVGRIPASTPEAIRKARANGVKCIVNTGRPYSHILPAVRDIGFDGYVCACGQHIVVNGKTAKRVRPTKEQARRVIELAEECRIDAYFEAEEGCLVSFLHPLNDLIRFQIEDFTRRGVPLAFGYGNKDHPVDKLCFWAEEGSDPEGFIRELADIYTVIVRSKGVYEMVMNGCTKATGIADILEAMGCPDAETYAIGDSMNDLPMLSAVDHPIAMGGAPDALSAKAEFVTERLEDDGLYKALAHFGLI